MRLWMVGLCLIIISVSQHVNALDPQLYDEPWRPQVHFTPKQQWMNDPNGLVYMDGNYHLFYQYHPYGNSWGPMHWGHAISQDLLHWQHQTIALFPDQHGTIFSGSVVFDRQNTSGLGTDSNPPLVALFTYANYLDVLPGQKEIQSQGLAFSLDKGYTWQKYHANPVLPNPGILDFRDPKIHWHAASQRWVMALAVNDVIRFYTSSNLIDWQYKSSFGEGYGSHGGVWECPDLFPMQSPDGKERYLLIISQGDGAANGGSGSQYFIGDFDGENFTPDAAIHRNKHSLWLDFGTDNYAGVTWSNLPAQEKPVFIGWMSNWRYAQQVPTNRWRSAMTLPRRLDLVLNDQGELRLQQRFTSGFDEIISKQVALDKVNLDKILILPLTNPANAYRFKANFSLGDKTLNFTFSNDNEESFSLVFEPATSTISIDRRNAGLSDFDPRFAAIQVAPLNDKHMQSMEFVLDASSIEVLADDGKTVLTVNVFPSIPYNAMRVEGPGTIIKEGYFQWLNSIWH